MLTFLTAIHVTVCLALIFIVLVQGGKGAEIGAAFGGGASQTLFGGRGAATFLGKITTIVAVVFMITALALTVLGVKGTSVVKPGATGAPTTSMPTAPAGMPGGPVSGGPVAGDQATPDTAAQPAPAAPLDPNK